MTGGDSMDATSLDDWELLPDHNNSYFMEDCTVGGKDQLLLGSNLVMISMDYFTPGPASHPSPYNCILEEKTKKSHLPPFLQDAAEHDPLVEFKDIGVVHTKSSREELALKVSEVQISDAEEEEQLIKSPAGGEEVCEEDEVMVEAASDLHDDEGEEGVKGDREGLEFVGFSVGKLRVNGVGALCSFGVAAATFCIFLLGGKQQNQKKMQGQKIQFQMYADDERIQQASILNQAVSSVMGGASTRASISFGGYYDGF